MIWWCRFLFFYMICNILKTIIFNNFKIRTTEFSINKNDDQPAILCLAISNLPPTGNSNAIKCNFCITSAVRWSCRNILRSYLKKGTSNNSHSWTKHRWSFLVTKQICMFMKFSEWFEKQNNHHVMIYVT